MLTISVTSSNPSVVVFRYDNNNPNSGTFTLISAGESTITVTADDGRGGTVSHSFSYGIL